MTYKRVAMKLVCIILIWAVVVLHLPVATTLAQGPTLTPNRLDVRLRPGECVSENISVFIEDTTPPKLDVVFLLDVSGSMQGITQITSNIQSIADRIRDSVPDTAFALATVADYPGDDRDADIEPWSLVQPFTADVATLSQAMASLKLYSSGDEEEAYVRALYETQFLPWRPESRRIVLLFGDANAHNPDVGRDGLPNTADDLHQHDVAAQLAAAHITILAASPRSAAFLETMAYQTGGQFYTYLRNSQIPDRVDDLVTGTIRRINTLNFRQIDSDQINVAWEPNNYATVQDKEALDFTMRACASKEATAGDYVFPLIASGDGIALGQVGLAVSVPGIASDAPSDTVSDMATTLTTTTTITEPDTTFVFSTLVSTQTDQLITDTIVATASTVGTNLQLPLISNNAVITDDTTSTEELTVTSDTVRSFSWVLLGIILLPFIGMLLVYLYEHKIDPARQD